MADLPEAFQIGLCSNGPVLLSESDNLEHKFVLAIANYDKSKHRTAISCKTTSKNIERVYPGEIVIHDFFGRGTGKIQPYNVVHIPTSDLESHRYIGDLDYKHLPDFKLGLRIAVHRNMLTPEQVVRVADSWSHIFQV